MNAFLPLLPCVLFAMQSGSAISANVTVSTSEDLRAALSSAGPGTLISLSSGTYQGGISAHELRGEPGRPIVIAAEDAEHPPVIRGGGSGLHLVGPAFVELRGLVIEGASGNGLNIDDGGSYETPAHHVTLRGLTVRDVGPEGNRDGIKLSGVDEFRVEDCTIERWGSGGSGIDMVGCHQGVIEGCTFNGDRRGGNGVQTKGGSRAITVRRCRFEHAGDRAVNIGGSTGRPYFRPLDPGYEAKDITVEDCTIIGARAGVAFVGVDGATVRHNIIYRPGRYALRILQESRGPDFVPSRNGRFVENIIAFRSDEMVIPINIGDGTAPETFTLAGNVWYCLDAPDRSRPRLPIPETDGRYGVAPRFLDPEAGDLRLPPDSPARPAGPRPVDADAG